MSDLRKSGGSLREFTGLLDHFNTNIDGVDSQIWETEESIARIGRNIETINENIGKLRQEKEKEVNLTATLQERKNRTLQEIERAKAEIAELKELVPSDIARLEVSHENLLGEIRNLQEQRTKLQTQISVQSNLVEQVLSLSLIHI